MGKALKKGSSGHSVRAVQHELKHNGSPKLRLTGIYDAETEAAVSQFQEMIGLRGDQINGVVGKTTMVSLFRTYDIHVRGKLVPKLRPPSLAKPIDLRYHGNPSLEKCKPTDCGKRPGPWDDSGARGGSSDDDDPSERFQANWQFGPQQSQRDGFGYQFQLSLTAKSKPYFPAAKYDVFRQAHFEVVPALTMGIPVAPASSIYTGQIGVTVQPITDWLVLHKRLHLLSPQFGVYAQRPLNTSSDGATDPSSHGRVGLTVGGTIFQVDLGKNGYSIGMGFQEAFYHDFTDRKLHWDPSIAGFLQGTLGSW